MNIDINNDDDDTNNGHTDISVKRLALMIMTIITMIIMCTSGET